MPQGAVPRRYAEAAFALAREQKQLDRWRTDLRVAAGVLSDPRLLAVLEDPSTSTVDKHKLIDGALTVAVDPGLRHLLYLLADRGRISRLQRVVDEFIAMANREQGIVVANVTTAVPLDAQHQQAVADRLKRIAGAQQVELRNQVDPRILGGIVAQIGDELYDGSVRTRLAQLAERIS
ncbi:MAG TPA: ATP synthase F1 subunit delta [Chloroflexia bacterium]|nr:ATP synthase F1 subunit delta [Chloroflexia bacterium]